MTIQQKIDQINTLLAEVRAFREANPGFKCGYAFHPGGILNAYREGDLSLAEAITAIVRWAEQSDSLREREARLRRLLWMRHGCGVAALYGDDGEMQCGKCLLDFQHDSIERIEQRFAEINKHEMEAQAALAVPAEPRRCSMCAGEPLDMEPDKDCICGGARTVEAELAGLRACIRRWRAKAQPSTDREWLRKKAEAEDGCCVSVGGLVTDIEQRTALDPALREPQP